MNNSIETKNQDLKLERKILSAEEADQMLEIDTKKWKNNQYLVTVFGKSNIEKLIDILQNGSFREIDFLYLTGELNRASLIEYVLQMPEYHETRKQLLILADQMAEFLSGSKLNFTIEKILNFYHKVKEWEERNPSKVALGIKAPYQMNHYGFAMMFLNINTLFKQISGEGESLCRLLCVADFIMYLEQRFGLLLQDKINSDQYSKDESRYLSELLAIYERSALDVCDVDPAVVLVRDFKANTARVLATYKEKFSEVLADHEAGEMAVADLREYADIKFEEIKELSLFRRIEFAEKDFGDSALQIYLDDVTGEASLFRALQACIVRVSFDMNRKWDPPYYENAAEGGFGKVGYSIADSYFECVLDRSTGALNMCHSAIPVSVVMDDRQYYLFKNVVFDFILEYLRGKAEDIDEQLAPSPRAMDVVGETREKIKPTWVWNGYTPAEETKHTDVDQPKVNSFDWSAFPSIRKKDFMSALDKILGGPIRCKATTHHIYRGLNGKNAPVPYGDGDIGIGLLKKILKMLDIDPQLLLDHLS